MLEAHNDLDEMFARLAWTLSTLIKPNPFFLSVASVAFALRKGKEVSASCSSSAYSTKA